MDYTARLVWLIVGVVVGFILGYVARSSQQARENHDGSLWHNMVKWFTPQSLGLLVVIALVVLASFNSQRASDKVADDQDRVARITACDTDYTTKVLAALNARAQFTTQQAQVNVDVRKAQLVYLKLMLEEPPITTEAKQQALQRYVNQVMDYIDVSEQYTQTIMDNDFPKPQDFNACLMRK